LGEPLDGSVGISCAQRTDSRLIQRIEGSGRSLFRLLGGLNRNPRLRDCTEPRAESDWNNQRKGWQMAKSKNVERSLAHTPPRVEKLTHATQYLSQVSEADCAGTLRSGSKAAEQDGKPIIMDHHNPSSLT